MISYAKLIKNFWHVKNPRLNKANLDGASYRWQDVGRAGHTMRLAAYNKKTEKWLTTTWAFHRNDVKVVKRGRAYTLAARDPKVAGTIQGIRANWGKIRVVR